MAKSKDTERTPKKEVKDEVEENAGASENGGPAAAPTKLTHELYEELCSQVNAIAQPMASRKHTSKVCKLVRAAVPYKDCLRQGISDVQRAFRRSEKGVVILAGNVTPVDVYSHIPAMCEEKEIPYIYVPSREHLGLAAGHRRPSIVVMVREHEAYKDLYEDVKRIIAKSVVPE